MAVSPGDPQVSPSMEKNASVPCLKGGLGNISAPLCIQCCNDFRDHPSASQIVVKSTQDPWQGLWSALQKVPSLATMLAWPAEHLQELQNMLTALTPRQGCDSFWVSLQTAQAMILCWLKKQRCNAVKSKHFKGTSAEKPQESGAKMAREPQIHLAALNISPLPSSF